ncbi:AbgT family transporter, partial [Escherichia coli]|uniref:AbgT family transporter n=1 Tax=Escherichia coli TaxID=562 RepID=UPI0034D25FC6
MMDESFTVSPVDNWFFNIASVIVLTIVGGQLTSKFIEPRLGTYKGEALEDEETEEHPHAKKAFINSVIAGLIYIAVVVG